MAISLDYALYKNMEDKASSEALPEHTSPIEALPEHTSPIEALPEFTNLINKMGNVFWVKNIDENKTSVPKCALGYSRVIRLGRSFLGNDKIFIKRPYYEVHFYRKLHAKQEQIAYLISSRLNLNVVPSTIAIEGCNGLINRKVSQCCKSHFLSICSDYEGVVVQEGMDLDSEQIHLNKGKRNAAYLILQLNNEQLANAIIFNLITGRNDADERNSAIDTSKRIMEFDNEYIGEKSTNSWLLKFFPDFVLPKESIANLLSKDVSIIDSVFKDMSQFQITRFWNKYTEQFDIEDRTQIYIVDNFNKLKKFLGDHKDADIRVSDLAKYNAERR